MTPAALMPLMPLRSTPAALNLTLTFSLTVTPQEVTGLSFDEFRKGLAHHLSNGPRPPPVVLQRLASMGKAEICLKEAEREVCACTCREREVRRCRCREREVCTCRCRVREICTCRCRVREICTCTCREKEVCTCTCRGICTCSCSGVCTCIEIDLKEAQRERGQTVRTVRM